MILKVISLFLLDRIRLITGSSNIVSSENLAEKRPFSAEKLEFPLYIATKYDPSGTLSNSG